MKLETLIRCSKCHEPISSGDACGFVCFKMPGKEGYQFFHRHSQSGDCWEAYLKEGKST